MSRRRHRKQTTIPPVYPQYEWAIAPDGWPVHISRADRGTAYTCPVCQGRMIAKQGAIKQHHYAHESDHDCAPDVVARVAARRWLVLDLRALLDQRRSVTLSWPYPLCGETHTADLLRHVTTVAEAYLYAGDQQADVALLDESDTVRHALLFARPASEELRDVTEQGIMLLVVDTDEHRLTPDGGLEAFLAGARIYGGMCTTQRSAATRDVITDPAQIRSTLIDAVAAPPHYLYGALEQDGNLSHVFTLGDRRLWLPPVLWRRAIGGTNHAVTPGLEILAQELRQPDDATVALYYVTARTASAIAVRRFPPGEGVYARLNQKSLQGTRLTALSVARSFAEE